MCGACRYPYTSWCSSCSPCVARFLAVVWCSPRRGTRVPKPRPLIARKLVHNLDVDIAPDVLSWNSQVSAKHCCAAVPSCDRRAQAASRDRRAQAASRDRRAQAASRDRRAQAASRDRRAQAASRDRRYPQRQRRRLCTLRACDLAAIRCRSVRSGLSSELRSISRCVASSAFFCGLCWTFSTCARLDK